MTNLLNHKMNNYKFYFSTKKINQVRFFAHFQFTKMKQHTHNCCGKAH